MNILVSFTRFCQNSVELDLLLLYFFSHPLVMWSPQVPLVSKSVHKYGQGRPGQTQSDELRFIIQIGRGSEGGSRYVKITKEVLQRKTVKQRRRGQKSPIVVYEQREDSQDPYVMLSQGRYNFVKTGWQNSNKMHHQRNE